MLFLYSRTAGFADDCGHTKYSQFPFNIYKVSVPLCHLSCVQSKISLCTQLKRQRDGNLVNVEWELTVHVLHQTTYQVFMAKHNLYIEFTLRSDIILCNARNNGLKSDRHLWSRSSC